MHCNEVQPEIGYIADEHVQDNVPYFTKHDMRLSKHASGRHIQIL